MGIFKELSKLIPDKGVRSVAKRVGSAADKAITHGAYEADRNAFFAEAERTGERTTPAEFPVLPMTLEELVSSPYNDLRTPINTAALFVVALNAYGNNRNEAVAMINYLRGPNPLSENDVNLLDDALSQTDAVHHLARSYLAGATPQNGYTPSQPYTIFVIDNPYTYLDTNAVREYARLLVRCGGDDTPRAVTMRKSGNGLWHLWEHSLFDDITPPV